MATEPRDLEDEWSELARRLKVFLHHKGVSPGRREDIVQETAARLVQMWGHVDPAKDLWPLTKTIAANLLRDEARRRFEEIPSEIPDVPVPHDLEIATLARLELIKVRMAMSEMSPDHREVLLAETGQPSASLRGRDADKMMRMRARRRLRELMKKLPAAIPAKLRATEFAQVIGAARDGAFGGLACLACMALPLGTIGWVEPPRAAGPKPQTAHSIVSGPVTFDPVTVVAPSALEIPRAGLAPDRPASRVKAPPDDTDFHDPAHHNETPIPPLPTAPGVPGNSPVPEDVDAGGSASTPTAPTPPAVPPPPLPGNSAPVEELLEVVETL